MSLRHAKQGTIFWVVALMGLGLVTYTQLKPESAPAERTILAMGMAPQIALIEDIASDHGWKVDCTGKSGGMTVARLTPGLWPWRGSYDETYEAVAPVWSSGGSGPRADKASDTCDLPDDSYRMTITDLETDLVLGVGSREKIAPLMGIAKQCEVRGARLEQASQEDSALYGGPVPGDAIRLVVDPKIEARTGPLSCLVLMSHYSWENDDNGD